MSNFDRDGIPQTQYFDELKQIILSVPSCTIKSYLEQKKLFGKDISLFYDEIEYLKHSETSIAQLKDIALYLGNKVVEVRKQHYDEIEYLEEEINQAKEEIQEQKVEKNISYKLMNDLQIIIKDQRRQEIQIMQIKITKLLRNLLRHGREEYQLLKIEHLTRIVMRQVFLKAKFSVLNNGDLIVNIELQLKNQNCKQRFKIEKVKQFNLDNLLYLHQMQQYLNSFRYNKFIIIVNRTLENEHLKHSKQKLPYNQILSNSCQINSLLLDKKQTNENEDNDIFCTSCNQKQLFIDQLQEEIQFINSEKYTLKDKVVVLEEQLEMKKKINKDLQQAYDNINRKVRFQTIQKQLNFIQRQNETQENNFHKVFQSGANPSNNSENQKLQQNQHNSNYQNLFSELNQINLRNTYIISSDQAISDKQNSKSCKKGNQDQNYMTYSDYNGSLIESDFQTMNEYKNTQKKQHNYHKQYTRTSQFTASQNLQIHNEKINSNLQEQLIQTPQQQIFENQNNLKNSNFSNLLKKNSLSESSLQCSKKIREFSSAKEDLANLQNYLQQINIFPYYSIQQNEIEQIYNYTSPDCQQIKKKSSEQKQQFYSSIKEYSNNSKKEQTKQARPNKQQNTSLTQVEQNVPIENNEQSFESERNLFDFNQSTSDNQDQNKVYIEDILQFNQLPNQIYEKQQSSQLKYDNDSKIQQPLIEDLQNLMSINNSQENINTSFSKDEIRIKKYDNKEINKEKQSQNYDEDDDEEEKKEYNDSNSSIEYKNKQREPTQLQSHKQQVNRSPKNVSNCNKPNTDYDKISYRQQEEENSSFNDTNCQEDNDKDQTYDSSLVVHSNVNSKYYLLQQALIKRSFFIRMLQWIIFFMLLPISIFFSRKTFLKSLKK